MPFAIPLLKWIPGIYDHPLDIFDMFFSSLPCREDHSEDDRAWRSVSGMMMLSFLEKEKELKDARKTNNWKQIEQICSGLEEMMEQYKPDVKRICLLLLDGACKSSQFLYQSSLGQKTASFIYLMKQRLRNLERRTHLIAPVKKQFAFVHEELELFGTFLHMAGDAFSDQATRSDELISRIRVWASQMSLLACFYWTSQESDESLAISMLFDHMYTLEVIALYLDVLMGFRYIQWILPAGFLVSCIVFLLERMVSSEIEILREALLFLLSFVLDGHTRTFKGLEEREVIVVEIYDIVMTQVPSIICTPDPTNLSSFFHRTDMVKTKVRGFCAFTPLPPPFKSPQAMGIELLDSFLTKLQEMLIREGYYTPSIKHTLASVQEELASLRSFIHDKWVLKKEFHDVWTQIVNVAYFAVYAAEFCSSSSLSVWYGMSCLPALTEKIKLVKSLAKDSQDDAFLPKDVPLSVGGLFIGFKEDVEKIVQKLTCSVRDLNIISILGMAGQGKTSVAKRIYNDPSIHHHFFEKVWCHVSKECEPKTLLVNIASDLGCNINVDLETKDLIGHISHCLKGKRYLIIFDDMWDADLWKVVKSSFPDDKNGSRILFTSRNLNITLGAELCSNPYHLRFFTDEESWELIRAMVFDCDGCLPDLLRIGKKIAVSCKGLPLAVALVASILKRNNRVLEFWEEVATNMTLHLAREGLTDILALSYDHLPAYLKVFFLYFGSFPRGQNISVKKLRLLWMADELVVGESCEELAGASLDALISHSLVFVDKRRSTGEMKSCKVHDLLFDLCIERGVQDNFLQLIDGNSIVGECHSNPQKPEFQFQHRLCVHEAGSFTPPKAVCTRNQLSPSRVHSILWSGSCSYLHKPLSSFLSRFKVLTIVDLEDLYLRVFPQVILQNIHLRHLALRGLIEHIPPSVADLCDLETLIVKRASRTAVELPGTFWEKKSLRYVHIDSVNLPPLNDESDAYTTGTCNIEVLNGVVFKYRVKVEMFLKRLTRLRKMKCFCNGVLDPIWLGSSKKLESLNIQNGYGGSSLMLPNQPSPSLHFPKSLIKLVIEECGLPWSVMSTVGSLPYLRVLKLRKWACVGTTWHLGNGEFFSLEYLELFDLDVERIDAFACKKRAFCNLENLLLKGCMRLESIESFLSRIYRLETIDISGSPVATNTVRQFLKENQRVTVFGLEDKEAG